MSKTINSHRRLNAKIKDAIFMVASSLNGRALQKDGLLEVCRHVREHFGTLVHPLAVSRLIKGQVNGSGQGENSPKTKRRGIRPSFCR